MRPTFSPEALYSVIKPTSSKAPTAASRWRSIWRPRNASRRLIILGCVLGALRFDLRLLTQQEEIQQRACHGSCRRRAVTPIFHQHGHGDGWRLRRRVGDE